MSGSVRTLVLARRLSHPPVGGSAIRLDNLVQAASKLGPVGLFVVSTLKREPAAPVSPPGVAFFEFACPPQPSWRPINLLDLGSPLSFPFTRKIASRLRGCLRDFAPDLVIFSEPNLAAYAPLVKESGLPLIYDAHNLEALNYRRFPLTLREGLGASVSTLTRRMVLRHLERKLVLGSDFLWVCSENERTEAKRIYGQRVPIDIIPNVVDVERYARPDGIKRPSADRKQRLLFPATFDYPPNRVAARFLAEKILPSLKRRFPDLELQLAGNAPSPEIRELSKIPGISVTNYQEDLRPFFWGASAVVIPLDHGGGTRLKALEAFAARVPVITTPVGVENLPVEPGRHCLVVPKERMVDEISRVLSDQNLVDKMVSQAHELVARRFSLPLLNEIVKEWVKRRMGASFIEKRLKTNAR